jgi:uroporphyrinogen decarboxylase
MPQPARDWLGEMTGTRRRSALPVLTYPGHGLIGETVRSVVTNPRTQFECIRAIADRFPMPAALTVMDLSVEAEAFGCPVQFYDHDIPTIMGEIVSGSGDLEALGVPRAGAGRTGVAIEAARLACEWFTDRPVLGGMIGPFSLAVRLRDMTQVMMETMMDPDFVHAMLDKTTAFLSGFAAAFKNAGASGVFVAEPAAGLLAPQQCEEFSSAYMRRIIENTQDDAFAIILHNCGQVTGSVPSMLGTGARALHFGNAVDMLDILPQVPANVPVLGNVNPAGVLCNGSPEDVRLATGQLLAATSSFPHFVLSSGCDIPPETPLENIDAFFSALDAYNDTC